MVGILFPPSLLGAAVAGAAVGGIGGHFRRGLSRSDVTELGDLVERGRAALLIVGRTRLDDILDQGRLNADKYVYRQLGVHPEDIDKAVRDAVRDIG